MFISNFLIPIFIKFNKDEICVYILFVGLCTLPGSNKGSGKIVIQKFTSYRKITLIHINGHETNAVYISRILRKKIFFCR